MAGHGRPPGFRFWPISGGLILAMSLFAQAASAVQRMPDTMRSDAQLTAVSFVDAAHGWTVGDRGAIWRTDDGGEHWRLQNSGVDCRLEAVQFLDARHGWAAGGTTQPHTLASHGVL